MTKFEEELFYKVPCKIELPIEAEYKKSTLINHFKNWHSDEEFQELKEEYSNQAESILSMLDEIKSLKSQLRGLYLAGKALGVDLVKVVE